MQGAGEFSASVGTRPRVLDLGDERDVKAALQAGLVLGFPTETVWGLGVTAARAEASERLAQAKHRPPGKPFQVLCEGTEAALALVAPPAHDRVRALSALWPGPLTLVVEADATCPPWLASQGRVGLRVPDHVTSRRLAALAGGYLAGSSFNRSGGVPARNFEEARAAGLAEVLIRGEAAGGEPSTVFDVGSGALLRSGGVPAEALYEAWACAR